MLAKATRIVLNGGMTDSELIEKLGGPAKLARTLGYHGKFGTQRVTNWKTRGIPARVLLDHREVFAIEQKELKPEAA